MAAPEDSVGGTEAGEQQMIIAMWSGPRNLSTALMRSFAQRADTAAWDEPFYAAYLKTTGLQHPMFREVIEAGISQPEAVARACLEMPAGASVFYQKHMTHHMLPGYPMDWTQHVTNAFLLRSPEHVLASYVKKHETVGAADIGFAMQRELFDRSADRLGHAPPVIDSTDIRRSPEKALRALCAALKISFDPAMLSWKPGPAPEDGVWGVHWYDGIWKSRGFAPPEGEPAPLPARLAAIADAVREDYQHLKQYKLLV
jgi:hypothetical protein